MIGHHLLSVPLSGVRLMVIVLLFVVVGCDERTTCKVRVVNSAAGIGSMQRLVVRIENDLLEHSHVDLVNPPEQGFVELRLLSSRLERLASGEQSSRGKFSYEVEAADRLVKEDCVGELTKCADEIAQAVLASCPGT